MAGPDKDRCLIGDYKRLGACRWLHFEGLLLAGGWHRRSDARGVSKKH